MGRNDDSAEKNAERYLRHLGYRDIVPQPEGAGGKFPDFLIDGRIGVEVRRLIINDVDENGRLVSREDGTHAVCDYMRELLTSLGPPSAGVSWFVRSQFKRPFIKWSKLQPAIVRALKAFQDNPQEKALLKIADNFSLKVRRAGITHPDCFIWGSYDDLDNDEACLTDFERERNLKLCIEVKTKKRNKTDLKKAYSEWWLIFDDQIGYGTEFDCPDQMDIEHDWDKVIC